jgi:flagellin-like protein
MMRLFKNKKAVSPVIGTILMIMITMIGMTLLFAFVASYSQTYKAGIGSSVMESLTIEDIWLSYDSDTYNSHVLIHVYNSGKIDCEITSVYLDRLALNTNLNVEIKAGEHIPLLLNREDGRAWDPTQTYTFQVSTLRGSNFELKYPALSP